MLTGNLEFTIDLNLVGTLISIALAIVATRRDD
jgi:hypothetical protein